ncbi:hypothetical protein QE152_g6663 [Popillia japonica]|uniref:Uncharacterized protein n=1 Tax=Popillia japonica TaxID=7064 RepID=A0AAW1MH74_POPJA
MISLKTIFTMLLIWQNVANGLHMLFAGDFQGAYKKYETGGGVSRMHHFISDTTIFVYVGNFFSAVPTKEKAELAKGVFDILKPAAIVRIYFYLIICC